MWLCSVTVSTGIERMDPSGDQGVECGIEYYNQYETTWENHSSRFVALDMLGRLK